MKHAAGLAAALSSVMCDPLASHQRCDHGHAWKRQPGPTENVPMSLHLWMQMGTAEDVRKAEVYRITVSHKDGLWMYCQPRHGAESS